MAQFRFPAFLRIALKAQLPKSARRMQFDAVLCASIAFVLSMHLPGAAQETAEGLTESEQELVRKAREACMGLPELEHPAVGSAANVCNERLSAAADTALIESIRRLQYSALVIAESKAFFAKWPRNRWGSVAQEYKKYLREFEQDLATIELALREGPVPEPDPATAAAISRERQCRYTLQHMREYAEELSCYSLHCVYNHTDFRDYPRDCPNFAEEYSKFVRPFIDNTLQRWSDFPVLESPYIISYQESLEWIGYYRRELEDFLHLDEVRQPLNEHLIARRETLSLAAPEMLPYLRKARRDAVDQVLLKDEHDLPSAKQLVSASRHGTESEELPERLPDGELPATVHRIPDVQRYSEEMPGWVGPAVAAGLVAGLLWLLSGEDDSSDEEQGEPYGANSDERKFTCMCIPHTFTAEPCVSGVVELVPPHSPLLNNPNWLCH